MLSERRGTQNIFCMMNGKSLLIAAEALWLYSWIKCSTCRLLIETEKDASSPPPDDTYAACVSVSVVERSLSPLRPYSRCRRTAVSPSYSTWVSHPHRSSPTASGANGSEQRSLVLTSTQRCEWGWKKKSLLEGKNHADQKNNPLK